MCRETSRRQIIAWASALLVGMGFLLFNSRYISNFVRGPYALQANELDQIKDIRNAPHYFVSVVGEKVLDTGVQEITTTTRDGVEEGRQVSAGYYAVIVGDRFLIVKSPDQPPPKVEGELSSFPPDLSSQLFSGPDGRELQSRSYPFYVESAGFRYPGYWGIAIGTVFIALLIFYCRPAWIHLQDINKHPVVARLNRWGDPIGISFDVEQELTNAVRFKSRKVFITDKYVILKRFFKFNLSRFEDLLWAYKKVIKKSVNFIPVGKDYQAILVFYGGSQTYLANETLVDKVLGFASTRAPWAIFGFSKEIDKLFRKQTSAFCQAVEATRKEISNKNA